MPGFYETWMGSTGFGPNWMHDAVGNAYWGVVGAMIDQQVARMKLAVRCRYPQDALAAGMSDALDEIGKDRLLPRGAAVSPGESDETDANYAARLLAAWDTWEKAGTPLGLLRELAVHGFPTGATGAMIVNHLGIAYVLDHTGQLLRSTPCAVCVNRTDLHGVIPSTLLTGFTLDARDQFFSHFMIIFLQAAGALANNTGNPVKACLNQIVRRWRCGGAIYNGAAVVPSGAGVWGWPPTDTWGDGGVWGWNGAIFIDPE